MEVALAEFRKWGKGKWHLKTLIPNSIFLGPEEKLSSLYEFISSKEPSGHLKNMKLELKLERTFDEYFNFG